jgi:hypothetical protein
VAPAAEPAAAAEPTDLTGAPGLGIAPDIQKTLLNGAQVSAMVAVVTQVSTGVLPRDAGLQILQAAFGLSEEEAEDIMASAGLEPPPDEVAAGAQAGAEDEGVEPASAV